MTGMNKPGEKPISLFLSMRGFTHSGGARRIKASPTGRPDKPDQKEYTERRGVHLVCMRGESQRAVNPTNQPSAAPPRLLCYHPNTQKRGLGCTWSTALSRVGTTAAVCALVLSGSGFISEPAHALSASQCLLLCPGCQGCTSSG